MKKILIIFCMTLLITGLFCISCGKQKINLNQLKNIGNTSQKQYDNMSDDDKSKFSKKVKKILNKKDNQ